MSRAWWVTANEAKAKRRLRKSWHWRQFLSGGYSWFNYGGPEWIIAPAAWAHVREMRKGDLIFANQSGEGVVGVTRLKSDGYQFDDEGPFNTFDLDTRKRMWFKHPVPVAAIRRFPGAEKEIEALRAPRPTVREISPKGVDILVRAIGDDNPDQRGDVRRFVRTRAR